MSGVWMFRHGVARLVPNPAADNLDELEAQPTPEPNRPKVLIYCPTNQVMSNYQELREVLESLGWEIYPGCSDPDVVQYHKHFSPDLITLPVDFRRFRTIHMYDIVVKNNSLFRVRDVDESP